MTSTLALTRLPPEAQAVNVAADMSAGPSLAPGASRVFQGAMRQAPTWDDLAWLQQQTRLPLIVKGVLHGDDARRLQAMKMRVSYHGRSAQPIAVRLHRRDRRNAGMPLEPAEVRRQRRAIQPEPQWCRNVGQAGHGRALEGPGPRRNEKGAGQAGPPPLVTISLSAVRRSRQPRGDDEPRRPPARSR